MERVKLKSDEEKGRVGSEK
jgi:hypothetical protein